MRQTRKAVSLINTACLVYQSANDEMVSSRSKKYFENKPNIFVNELKKSSHSYYDKDDFVFLLTEFNKMLGIGSDLY